MPHILILTIGSRGDMQPCVALACSLQEASLEVTVAGPPNHARFVSSHSVPFRPIGIDTNDVIKAFTEDPNTPLMNDMWVRSNVDSWNLVAELKPSLVMFHTSVSVGLELMKHFGIPGIMFEFAIWEPNTSYPPYLATESLKGSWDDPEANWKSNVDLINVCWKAQLANVNKSLELVGYDAHALEEDYWKLRREMNVPKIHAWSPSVCPVDFRSDIDFTPGYWHLQEQYYSRTGWVPPQDLVSFIEAEAVPPIYVGFGSMSCADPENVKKALISAIRKSGQRAVVCAGWGEMWSSKEEHPDIFICDHCPHEWLFPRMRALVIHGGAGTVSAALMSGVPAIVVPFFCDQPFWAEVMRRKNLTVEAIPIAELTEDNLAKAIGDILADESISKACKEMRESILKEDGKGETIRIIRSVLN